MLISTAPNKNLMFHYDDICLTTSKCTWSKTTVLTCVSTDMSILNADKVGNVAQFLE